MNRTMMGRGQVLGVREARAGVMSGLPLWSRSHHHDVPYPDR